MPPIIDIAIIGAGAAGLMAAISAGRTAQQSLENTRRDQPGRQLYIVAFDSAKSLGAKILVAGGGRCNVTHDTVDESAFAGSTPAAIRKVLRRFTADDTVRFFEDLDVRLKREETGKLFPVTDRARTILQALLRAAEDADVELRHPAKIERIEKLQIASAPTTTQPVEPHPEKKSRRACSPGALDADEPHFHLTGPFGQALARRVILATGGKSLPKTGSDGHGYSLAQSLGHTLTPRILPALVPLTLARDCFLRELSGLSAPATLSVLSRSGKRLISITGPTLCTHVGLSGPAVLDISRFYLHALADDPAARLIINWLPDETAVSLDEQLARLGQHPGSPTPVNFLAARLPQRMARALCEHAGVSSSTHPNQLSRPQRRALAAAVTELPLPITGDLGYAKAEVTAGGVPLRELDLDTMESRLCPGLYLCGEICDVDGRIGGYNFQWAWASGFVAGAAAAAMAADTL